MVELVIQEIIPAYLEEFRQWIDQAEEKPVDCISGATLLLCRRD